MFLRPNETFQLFYHSLTGYFSAVLSLGSQVYFTIMGLQDYSTPILSPDSPFYSHSFLRVTSSTTPPTRPCQYSPGRVNPCRTTSLPLSVTSHPTPSTPSASRHTQASGRDLSQTPSKWRPNKEVNVLEDEKGSFRVSLLLAAIGSPWSCRDVAKSFSLLESVMAKLVWWFWVFCSIQCHQVLKSYVKL